MEPSEFEKKFREVTAPLAASASTVVLDESWKQLHNIFNSMQRGGFTEEQALRMVAYGVFFNPENKEEEDG